MTAKAFDWRRPLAWLLAVVVGAELTVFVTGALTSSTAVAVSDLYWGILPAITVVAALLILLARPNNGVGWLLMIWAVGIGADAFAAIPDFTLQEPRDRLTIGLYFLLLLQNYAWVFLIFPIFHLLQVFPTGRVLSSRWRWLMRLEFFMVALLLVLGGLAQELGPQFDEQSPWTLENPIGFVPASFFEGPLFGITWTAGLLVLTMGGLASLIVRYRRAGVEERGQIKWLLYAVTLFAAVYSSMALFADSWNLPQFADIFFGLSIALIPLAIAIAVLRYRLFDIDVVISRTLVYGLLALFIGGVYVAIV
ncbi:MAG: hypothetical protein WD354_08130, partial [Acidimicrobiia bacterium]